MNFRDLLPRREKAFTRAFRRFTCEIDCSMIIINRIIHVEGRLLDISAGGALFRPRLAYLMERRNEQVAVMIGSEELYGTLVNTFSAGYGLKFDEAISPEQMQKILRLNPAELIPEDIDELAMHNDSHHESATA